MLKIIARLNIEHYLKRLAQETNEPRRQVILGLLKEEETKLAAFDDPPEGRRE